jgi:hypothetical protein
MTSDMELVVDAGGSVRCIYDEALDLRELGTLQITRASHVEPDVEGFWWADMGPSGGPLLGPFRSRSEALEAEREWLAIQPSLRPERRNVVSTGYCDCDPESLAGLGLSVCGCLLPSGGGTTGCIGTSVWPRCSSTGCIGTMP